MEHMGEMEGKNYLGYLVENKFVILLAFVSVTIIVLVASVIVSTYHVSHRDVSGGAGM